MKKKGLLLLLPLVLMIGIAVPVDQRVFTVQGESPMASTATTLETIFIDGDAAFAAFPHKTGSGTDLDPYVIEGITVTGYDDMFINGEWVSYAIAIINTNVNFVLKDMVVDFSGTRLFVIGMLFYNNAKGLVENADISNVQVGVGMYATSNIIVKDSFVHDFKINTLFGNYGFYCIESSSLLIENNDIVYGGENLIFGMSLQNVGDSSVIDNDFVGCGMSITSGSVATIASNVIAGNTVDGKQLVFLVSETGGNIRDHVVDVTDIGQLIMVDCDGITVDDVTISGGSIPLEVANSIDITVENVVITGSNRFGFQASNSENIIIRDSEFSFNGLANIVIGTSENCVVENCDLTGTAKSMRIIGAINTIIRDCYILASGDPKTTGIELLSSLNTVVEDCEIYFYGYGIYAGSFQSNPVTTGSVIKGNRIASILYEGIRPGTGSTILDNFISSAGFGIHLLRDGSIISRNKITSASNIGVIVNSNDNTITGNTFYRSYKQGVAISWVYDNVITGNAFIDNNRFGTIQAKDDGIGTDWDGNYWSDYTDLYPTATSNGIYWDTPYEIDSNSADNTPLAFNPTITTLLDTILIDGNDELEAFPCKSGSGTGEDPYVIENVITSGWEYATIPGTGSMYYSILVKNTDLPLVIKDVSIINTKFGGGGMLKGLVLYNVENVVVDSVSVEKMGYGFAIYSSSNVVVKDSALETEPGDPYYYGINGIHVKDSDTVTIENNQITSYSTSMENGIWLENVAHSAIKDNAMLQAGIWMQSNDGQLASTNEFSGNTVDGNPIVVIQGEKGGQYWKHVDASIDVASIGQLILVDCENIMVKDVDLDGGNVPLQILFSKNVKVKDATIANARYGISVVNSGKITVMQSTITGCQANVYLESSSKCTVMESSLLQGAKAIQAISCDDLSVKGIIVVSQGTGVEVKDSNGFSIKDSTFDGCNYGISDLGSERGQIKENAFLSILFYAIGGGYHNTITGNIIEGGAFYGIFVYGENDIKGNTITGGGSAGILLAQDGNIVIGNTILDSDGYAVMAWGDENRIKENNFIGTNHGNVQARDTGESNNWDGNYWSDYESRYPDAMHDGYTWDTPYEINPSSFDTMPLVDPVIF